MIRSSSMKPAWCWTEYKHAPAAIPAIAASTCNRAKVMGRLHLRNSVGVLPWCLPQACRLYRSAGASYAPPPPHVGYCKSPGSGSASISRADSIEHQIQQIRHRRRLSLTTTAAAQAHAEHSIHIENWYAVLDGGMHQPHHSFMSV